MAPLGYMVCGYGLTDGSQLAHSWVGGMWTSADASNKVNIEGVNGQYSLIAGWFSIDSVVVHYSTYMLSTGSGAQAGPYEGEESAASTTVLARYQGGCLASAHCEW